MTTVVKDHSHVRNVALMQRVLDFITEHPEQHNQGRWMGESTTTEVHRSWWRGFTKHDRTVCRTSGCIAGWACVLSKQHGSHYSSLGRQVLGITDDEAAVLFTCGSESKAKRMLAVLVVGGSIAPDGWWGCSGRFNESVMPVADDDAPVVPDTVVGVAAASDLAANFFWNDELLVTTR